MTLSEFKKEHRKDPINKKLDLLIALVDDVENDSMNCTLSAQHPGAYKVFAQKLVETKKKFEWLAAEIKKQADKLETRCAAMEEYLHEAEEYKDCEH